MLDIKTYASGSTGNLYTVSDGISTLMLECGVRIRYIIKNIDLEKIDGCLVTHEHQDHARSVKQLLEYCVPIYSAKETFAALDCKLRDPFIIFARPGELMQIETFQVLPFETQHDAKRPLGYYIKSTTTGDTLLFATDTAYIRPRFGKINYLLIEANYDRDLLEQSVAEGRVEPRVAQRIIYSHFELHNAIKFIDTLDKSELKKIILIHLSEHNAQEVYFKEAVRAHCPNCSVEIAPRII